MRFMRWVSLLVLGAASVWAQSPFDGTWAMNQQKSKLTGQTMKIEDAGNGAIRFADPPLPFTIKTDGTKTDVPGGSQESIEKKDANSYHETDWINGNETGQADWKISGKTLTIHSYGTKPSGEKFDDTDTYTRVSGSNGLPGEWKRTSIKMGAPDTMTIKTSGTDEMNWDITGQKATWNGKLDGKDYPATGPTIPKSLTLALTRKGDHSFDVTEKVEGKVVFTGTYTVSSDGKTLTIKGKNAQGEATSEVWEKKS